MIKRTFDLVFSVLISILFLPFWLAILLIPSLHIFKQIRIGQYGKNFTIYKLRTMEKGVVTKQGAFLRKHKIDELPQLINIIKGEMSFVGPRPDLPGYYDLLEGEERDILKLKPGLTSLAAIKYANEEAILTEINDPKLYNDSVIFPDKVLMNLDYIKKKSLRYDLYIVGLTLKAIFVKNNITI